MSLGLDMDVHVPAAINRCVEDLEIIVRAATSEESAGQIVYLPL